MKVCIFEDFKMSVEISLTLRLLNSIVTSNCIYLALTILIAMVSTAIPFGKLDLNKDSTSSLYMDYCYIYLVLDQLAFKRYPTILIVITSEAIAKEGGSRARATSILMVSELLSWKLHNS